MPVTTLKLPDRLKDRVTKIVASMDQSAHAFMIEAIEKQTTLAEQWKQFVTDALAAEKVARHTGKGYLANDVHGYLKAKASGKKVSRPKVKAWR